MSARLLLLSLPLLVALAQVPLASAGKKQRRKRSGKKGGPVGDLANASSDDLLEALHVSDKVGRLFYPLRDFNTKIDKVAYVKGFPKSKIAMEVKRVKKELSSRLRDIVATGPGSSTDKEKLDLLNGTDTWRETVIQTLRSYATKDIQERLEELADYKGVEGSDEKKSAHLLERLRYFAAILKAVRARAANDGAVDVRSIGLGACEDALTKVLKRVEKPGLSSKKKLELLSLAIEDRKEWVRQIREGLEKAIEDEEKADADEHAEVKLSSLGKPVKDFQQRGSWHGMAGKKGNMAEEQAQAMDLVDKDGNEL